VVPARANIREMVIDECGMVIRKEEPKTLREEPPSMPLCRPRILHKVTRKWARGSAVRNQLLTTELCNVYSSTKELNTVDISPYASHLEMEPTRFWETHTNKTWTKNKIQKNSLKWNIVISFIFIVWHVDQLLGNDREISNYTTAVAK
jgi:hypothetical protein